MVEELEKSAIDGDTLLDIKELLYKVRERFPGERECKPDLFLIKQNKKFYEERLTFLGDNDEFIALNEIRDFEKIISQTIKELIEDEYEDEAPDWEKIIENRLGTVEHQLEKPE